MVLYDLLQRAPFPADTEKRENVRKPGVKFQEQMAVVAIFFSIVFKVGAVNNVTILTMKFPVLAEIAARFFQ